AAVWEGKAVGVITSLARMNRGLDANGTPIGNRAQFYIGAAVNPNADDTEKEVRLLGRKLQAGANFLVTQPIYDVDAFRTFVEACGPLGVPLLVGVLPLVSARHAEFLHNEVPGGVIPEAVR